MIIEAFIIAWNREDTIHLTINYYKSFCQKVSLYDNHSTDRTKDIAESLGAEVHTFGTPGVLNDQHYLDVKNNCWKGSLADWVIVVDDDEILYDDILDFKLKLGKSGQYTIIQPQGFGVFSNEMPKEKWTDILTGVNDDNYSKFCVFDPKKIIEIGYIFGCHQAKPKGQIRVLNDLWLLHYRAVGGVDRLIERHRLYEPRRQKSAINMKWGLGENYKYAIENPQKTRDWFNENLSKSVKLEL